MSLRERLRRAVHEFTRPEPRSEAASQVLAPQPVDTSAAAVAVADVIRPLNLPRTPIDQGPWQCCYCNEHLYSPFAPNTPLGLPNSIVHQGGGHTSCGHCWLTDRVQWPCKQFHKLNRG